MSFKKNTVLVAFLTLISLVLGFGRESIIAYLFGSTQYTDAFYVAIIVPDIIAGWIGYTLTNALIPVLKTELDQSENSGKKLIMTAFNYVLIGATILAVTTFILVNPIINMLAPNFDHDQIQIGSTLLRVMSISIIFSALSGLMSGINNTLEKFLYPSLVGIFYNLFFLVSLLFLFYWSGIYALAYGFVAGVVGRFIIQIVPLLRTKKLTFYCSLRHPMMSKILLAMIPIFLSQALSQVNQIVDRIFASGLPYGHISNLNYASKLGLLPIGLVGSSIATTCYIRFVKYNNDGNKDLLEKLFIKALSWILFAGIVVGGGFIVFGESLISLFYYHGEFNVDDLSLTSDLLNTYGYFTMFYMTLPLIINFYFAQKAGKLVIISSLCAVIVNVLMGFILVRLIGVKGLVIANGLSQFTNVSILFTLSMYRLRANIFKNILIILKTAIPVGVCFIISYSLVTHFWPISDMEAKIELLLRGVSAVIIAVIFFLLVSVILDKNDISKTALQSIGNYVGKRIKKKVYQQ